MLGLKGLRIENSAREILRDLAQLSLDFKKFYEDFEKVGFHLFDARTAYEKAEKRLGRLEHQLDSLESQDPVPVLPGTTKD